MQDLFSALSHALSSSSVAMGLGAALVWGVLSVVLSPCHLASIPLIVGFISDQGETTRRRAFALSSLFALGILGSIVALGLATAAMGRMLGDAGRWSNYAIALVFVAVGLHLLDVLPLAWSAFAPVGFRRRGPAAALVLGLVFGVALGPCTFAFMAPAMAVAFKLAASNGLHAAAMLGAYGLGHCGVIAVAGGSTGWVQRYLDWNESSRGVTVVRRVCGALVVAAGFYLIHLAR